MKYIFSLLFILMQLSANENLLNIKNKAVENTSTVFTLDFNDKSIGFVQVCDYINEMPIINCARLTHSDADIVFFITHSDEEQGFATYEKETKCLFVRNINCYIDLKKNESIDDIVFENASSITKISGYNHLAIVEFSCISQTHLDAHLDFQELSSDIDCIIINSKNNCFETINHETCQLLCLS